MATNDNNAFNPEDITLSTDSTRWLKTQAEMHPHLNTTSIEGACWLAEQESADTLQYGLAIAEQLLEITDDSHAIAAAIAYPAVEISKRSKTQIEAIISKPVFKLLSGVNKMDAIHAAQEHRTKDTQYQNQIDNLRKMLLAMADDIRIVLIKLTQQVILLNRIKNEPEAIRLKHAQKTMNIYAPLANHLGVGQLKWQLEDLAFRYIQRDQYNKISNALNMRRVERETFIHRVTSRLKNLLATVYINNANISGRAKHIFSIYRKIQRKQVDISEIYDVSAVRILVDSIQDCYTVLGLVHTAWEHLPKEFDDYIAHPKPNGYRSIHTAVIGPENHVIEIQIRTKSMHEEAELGIAAHWIYKERRAQESSYERKITWLRQVMDWQHELSTKENNYQLFQDTFADQVYVFTPNGDIIDLTIGATALDFAYQIHSDLGHRCRGARINDKLQPLTTRLKTGDKVEIITTKIGSPSRDWLIPQLGYLATHHAIQKVKQYFRQKNNQAKLEAGIEIWERAKRQRAFTRQDLEQYAKSIHAHSVNDLLMSIGSGDLSIHAVVNAILQNTKPVVKKDEPIHFTLTQSNKSVTGFIIEGETDLLTHIAQCCKPIPGDDVLGFITLGRGVTIHKQGCKNLLHMQETTPERIIHVQWGDIQGDYPADIILHAKSISENELMRDAMSLIANVGHKITAMHTSRSDNKDEVSLTITLIVSGQEDLNKILARLQQMPNVMVAERVSEP